MAPSGAIHVSIGDPMPRVLLARPGGAWFDSWDQTNAGQVHLYWLDPDTAQLASQELAPVLAANETDWHVVAASPPPTELGHLPWLLDPRGDLARAVGVSGPSAVIVDAAGRLAAVIKKACGHDALAVVERLHAATGPATVQLQAPVLLLERVLEPELCARLIGHWRKGDKRADGVASVSGAATAGSDIKRRSDVPVDDASLYGTLRDALVRRVMPTILQAFQTRIVQIELPRIGCYDAETGGWFRRHRDNTTPYTAHRQFALSLNLNPPEEYEGGQVRFPEFGCQRYQPRAGAALVFSCSLLHEAVPVTRGRRFGLFTFLHDERHDAQYRRMVAEQQAKGMGGIRMRCLAFLTPLFGWEEAANLLL
jgi:predicted 2-oxoglutarate/Fe(II)-dependent dioxygenase YbiX